MQPAAGSSKHHIGALKHLASMLPPSVAQCGLVCRRNGVYQGDGNRDIMPRLAALPPLCCERWSKNGCLVTLGTPGASSQAVA